MKLKSTFFLMTVLFVFGMCVNSVFASDRTEGTVSAFTVSEIFGDGMVFQQNEPIRVWGTSEDEGERICAVFGDSVGDCIVKDGKWEIEFAPRVYSSESHVLEIYGNAECEYVTFEDIRIGDVWWVMGQSNIEYSTSATPEWFDFENSLTGNENITLYHIGMESFDGGNRARWRKFSKYSTYDTSALSCFVAKNMSDICSGDVPLAMVNMGYAGYEIASFMPPELLKDASFAKDKSNIYDAVIKHVEKMPVKGIIWYQGEADASVYGDYAAKFANFINWLRDTKHQDNYKFPVYAVELPPCFDDATDPQRQFMDFGNVRSEMGSLTSKLENFFLCSTSDLWSDVGYSNNLHPNNKWALSDRLAKMIAAREFALGYEDIYFNPVLKSTEISADGKTAKLKFDYCSDGLRAEKMTGFQIIDETWGEISDALIEITAPDEITVSADRKICIIKYNNATQNMFDRDIFIENSLSKPLAAFSCVFENPAAADNNDDGIIYKYDGKMYKYDGKMYKVIIALSVVAVIAIVTAVIIKRKKKMS